ncbi:MAG TPA: hypothetical protein VN969_23755 [Streptosporangiaceae bacterium]|nr:hypothetical protein [Streptosporangiaceae bacterium]
MRLRLVVDPDEVASPGAQDMPQAATAAQSECQCFVQQPDLGRVRIVGRPFQRNTIFRRERAERLSSCGKVGVGAESDQGTAAQSGCQRACTGIAQRCAEFADVDGVTFGEAGGRGPRQGDRAAAAGTGGCSEGAALVANPVPVDEFLGLGSPS